MPTWTSRQPGGSTSGLYIALRRRPGSLGIDIVITVHLPVLHLERFKLRRQRLLVLLGDGARLLLDVDVAAVLRDPGADHIANLPDDGNALLLVQRHGRDDVERRRDQLDGYGEVLSGQLQPFSQRVLHRVDAFVFETGHLEIGPNLDGLGSQAPLDLLQELGPDGGGHVQPGEDRLRVSDRQLERGARVPKLLVQWPGDGLQKVFHGDVHLAGHLTHDGVHRLGHVPLVLHGLNLLRRHTPLRQVNVPFLLVNAQDDDDLHAPDPDQLVHGSDAPAGQLRQEDHALDAIVLEQRHVRAHLGDALHLDHDGLVDLRESLLVHPALQVLDGELLIVHRRRRCHGGLVDNESRGVRRAPPADSATGTYLWPVG